MPEEALGSAETVTPSDVLYFAYGSNLDDEQMRLRCPSARFDSVAVLEGYELGFAGRSDKWGGAVATVRPRPGMRVQGAIYRIGSSELEALDYHEGVRRGSYERKSVDVRVPAGTVKPVLIYVKPLSQPHGSPSPAYVDAIRRGYLLRGFDVSTLEAAVQARHG